ncbi:T9SS type A sorting domain-containing protein [Spirosoma sp. KCTC 42546]|uniref:T9SS type A sorting domain-containing protein n=1 Tax=Spirosoma sp. KCTC 42546 TaxID=2520506 RepID=UPI00115A9499|nr:T9SS type A sorting domain-containing protein [Spirosoma sp. KCTC 42546]QDK78743.1 T9SS type A sorting domain-containing protein [Spirosoma sp. KCTC 42546]
MKKVLILMLGLVASTASFATVSTPQTAAAQTRVVMTPERKIKLYVQPLQAKGQVAILDASGQAVYTQQVALAKGLSEQFDVSSLGTGTFRLLLTTDNETVVKTFVVQANPNESFVVQD